MKFMIFQLKDTERGMMFLPTSYLVKKNIIKSTDDIRSNYYDFVYEAEVPAEWEELSQENLLEEIFEMFNINHPADYKGHSLSVSDVIEFYGADVESSTYYVEDVGFSKLNHFHEEDDDDKMLEEYERCREEERELEESGIWWH